ncbi:MAG: DUF5652 family protein [Minisyncoccia bacterium]
MDMGSIKLLAGLADVNPLIIVVALIWSLIWKGLALWKSSGLRQKYWFIAILLINTLGILEIIYLFVVSKGSRVEVIEKVE